MIADTTFLVDILRNSETAVKKASELENHDVPLLTTSVSKFEVLRGIRIKDEDKHKKVLGFMQSFQILDFDSDSSIHASNVYRELVSEGKIIEPEDSMIAGITIRHNETVLTRNVKHFGKIKNLKIETY